MMDAQQENDVTKDEAKKAYRQAWLGWCLTQDPTRKLELEQRMDDLQPRITRGPGPEWEEFTKSLPGFIEFWEGWYDEVMVEYDGDLGTEP